MALADPSLAFQHITWARAEQLKECLPACLQPVKLIKGNGSATCAAGATSELDVHQKRDIEQIEKEPRRVV